jgi:hypothetical protein
LPVPAPPPSLDIAVVDAAVDQVIPAPGIDGVIAGDRFIVGTVMRLGARRWASSGWRLATASILPT